jgi:uncharacterized membrane protein
MNKKKIMIIVLFSLSFSLTLAGTVYGQDYTGVTNSVKLYSDGSASVDMVIEPDPTLARLNVTLMGEIYDNVLAVDSDGIILSWEAMADGIEVDGLGVDQITISYSTSSLTNKTGSKWTALITSEVNTIVTLPKDAVLVGLNPAPLGITIIEDNAVVTMPAGTSTLSYLLGTTGTQEHALVLLTQAEDKIAEIKLTDIIVSQAEEILGQSQTAYDEGQYSLSEQLSKQARELALSTVELANQAMDSIGLAEDMIASKDGADVTDAQTLLDSAETAYEAGDYQKAIDDAQAAYDSAEEVEVSGGGLPVTYIVGGVVILAAAGGFLMMNRGNPSGPVEKPESIQPDVDLDDVFRNRPHLRTDDKAILRFIQESGGSFITEIREHFDIPKSSAWRMIRRLEEEELISSTTVGRETYLQLREQEEKQ